VGEMFVKRGAHLIQSDAVAHWLMEPGRAVYDEVIRRFGREILNADGSINELAWRNWRSDRPAAPCPG